jgi:hypothetical protein
MTRPNYYKASIPLGPEEIDAGKPGERMSAVIQPFHIIRALGMDFFAGNALKYLWRLGRKGLSKEERLADARKARTYVDEVIADIERESEP